MSAVRYRPQTGMDSALPSVRSTSFRAKSSSLPPEFTEDFFFQIGRHFVS